MEKTVSIVIPYVRHAGLKMCLEGIERNAGVPRDTFEIKVEYDGRRSGCPRTLKSLVDGTELPWIMFLGDDCYPQWLFLENALQKTVDLPDGWGMVGLNDHSSNQAPAHWMAHRELLPHLGGEFFNTGYWHCFCDNELYLRVSEMKRYVFAEDSQIVHINPICIPELIKWDGDYKKVYSHEWYQHDYRTFIKRRSEGWP